MIAEKYWSTVHVSFNYMYNAMMITFQLYWRKHLWSYGISRDQNAKASKSK